MSDIDILAARKSELEHQVAEVTRERDAVRDLLENRELRRPANGRTWLVAVVGAALVASVVIGVIVRRARDPRDAEAAASAFNYASYRAELDREGLRPVELQFVQADLADAPDGALIGLANGQNLVAYSSYRRFSTREVEWVREGNVIWQVHRVPHEISSETYEVDGVCSAGGSGAYDGYVRGGFALPEGTTYGGERTVEYDVRDVSILCLGGYTYPV